MKLDQKVVLITGAGGGIGQAAVRKFVSEGAKVMLADINTDITQPLVNELGADRCACVIKNSNSPKICNLELLGEFRTRHRLC